MLPKLLTLGGPMAWILIFTSAVALAVFLERMLHYHRAQINSLEFLDGVRNVLRQGNVVEGLSICDATPGPVARLVKAALLSRERGREGVREALEEAGMQEVPKLEEKLNVIATVAQIAPLMGLLGTALGFIDIFEVMELNGQYAHASLMAGGVWKALIATALGLAVAIPCYIGYNYLVSRVNQIVLDMERASNEIVNLVLDPNPRSGE